MILRILLAVVVIALAILVTPEMLKPGVNSADLIVVFAPITVAAIFIVRRPQVADSQADPQ